ncbi:hypothetical protein EV193_101967 [Herbihabitans rhizosphaerae]|uniref:Uncharacterized protein n=1 Tax=Herbihabitans rhizosphaerae TaxID=1872711 RepID=A0A4Q7L8T6_9PSEU|nr:hypothetical protein [Herbihabitans rhizosphaerae]RZS45081.1 hypothetical protein EV193_101967 [Herbihabitans rhizosphaerae]
MPATTSPALVILVGCLVITYLLTRTKMFGVLALTGFLLGSAATASAFTLWG